MPTEWLQSTRLGEWGAACTVLGREPRALRRGGSASRPAWGFWLVCFSQRWTADELVPSRLVYYGCMHWMKSLYVCVLLHWGTRTRPA